MCRPLPSQEEDTIDTTESQKALKEIPVPKSQPQERATGGVSFRLPAAYIRAPGQRALAEQLKKIWDIDPAGFGFLIGLNKGDRGYTGPPIDEALFERVIDRFEKAVVKDVLPQLPAVTPQLTPLVPDASLIPVMHTWWIERRKQLAMPLVRLLRPPPDPEDPDTTGVAFRPREVAGVKRFRSNNKKSFTLMAQLRDEFLRLRQLLELVRRRERMKRDLHRTAGEYMEAAHRTLMHRFVRQRDPRASWKGEMEENHPRAIGHRKGGGGGGAAPRRTPPRSAATRSGIRTAAGSRRGSTRATRLLRI